jgi:hypothetical protein
VLASTVTVAVAVPPTPAAGARPPSVMEPGTGEGVTLVMAMPVTVPSASEALTWAEAAVPWSVVSGPPQLATTGWLVGQGLAAVEVLRGLGAPAVKSAALSSVSVQPPARRSTATALPPAGAGPDPSKKFAPS